MRFPRSPWHVRGQRVLSTLAWCRVYLVGIIAIGIVLLFALLHFMGSALGH